MFKNRKDAGEKLANALFEYKDSDSIVLAIPRGGVEIGYQVAMRLNLELSIIISRKLPFPNNPESGFGAIAEDGSTFIFKEYASWVSPKQIERIIEKQKEEILRRIQVLRKGKPLPGIEGRTVILVDDGIAMGSTMRASIQLCNNLQAGKIVVGTPVTGEDTWREISEIVDEMVVLEVPPDYRAVAQVYRNWYDVSDEEVLRILSYYFFINMF